MARNQNAGPQNIPVPPAPDVDVDDSLNESPEHQLARERQANAIHGGVIGDETDVATADAASSLLGAAELGFRTTSRGRSRGSYSDELDDHAVHSVDEEPLDLMHSNVPVLNFKEELTVITEREFRDKAEYERFMEDPLVIVINETSDEKAPPIVFVGSNGDGRWIPRAIPVKIQRKYVERLAQSQERHYVTTPNKDTSADNAMLVKARNVGISFHVLKDPHPRGQAWLRRVMRSGY